MNKNCKIIGHRGCMGNHFENSRSGFQAILDMGLHFIEIDIVLCAGELLVFHDHRLERLSTHSGTIAELTPSGLEKLVLKNGEAPMRLSELCHFLKARVAINIEIKTKNVAEKLFLELSHLVNSGPWQWNQFLISSFDHDELHLFQKHAGALAKIAYLIYGTGSYIKDLIDSRRAFSIHFSLDFLDEEYIRYAQEAGMQVFVFTHKQDSDLEPLSRMGIDGIFSDFPQKAIQAFPQDQHTSWY